MSYIVVRRGPSHDQRQHVQKISRCFNMRFLRYESGQTDRQTHMQTPIPRAGDAVTQDRRRGVRVLNGSTPAAASAMPSSRGPRRRRRSPTRWKPNSCATTPAPNWRRFPTPTSSPSSSSCCETSRSVYAVVRRIGAAAKVKIVRRTPHEPRGWRGVG